MTARGSRNIWRQSSLPASVLNTRSRSMTASSVTIRVDNTPEPIEILKRRHDMHRLTEKWTGSSERHLANAGDWLIIWRTKSGIAYSQRTGTRDELFL